MSVASNRHMTKLKQSILLRCIWLSYSWFQTSQTGGQWFSGTSPFSIPCPMDTGWGTCCWSSPWRRPPGRSCETCWSCWCWAPPRHKNFNQNFEFSEIKMNFRFPWTRRLNGAKTLSITTLSIVALSKMTFSIVTFSITINKMLQSASWNWV